MVIFGMGVFLMGGYFFSPGFSSLGAIFPNGFFAYYVGFYEKAGYSIPVMFGILVCLGVVVPFYLSDLYLSKVDFP